MGRRMDEGLSQMDQAVFVRVCSVEASCRHFFDVARAVCARDSLAAEQSVVTELLMMVSAVFARLESVCFPGEPPLVSH